MGDVSMSNLILTFKMQRCRVTDSVEVIDREVGTVMRLPVYEAIERGWMRFFENKKVVAYVQACYNGNSINFIDRVPAENW
jgi:hypothetical protein